MVPWRCEYTWLLPAWPLACIIWLLMALILLYFMMESIHIYNPADRSTKYNILNLMLLPYTVMPQQDSNSALPSSPSLHSYGDGEELDRISTSHIGAPLHHYHSEPHSHRVELRRHASSSSAPTIVRRNSTALLVGRSNCMTIRIVMPSSFGFRSWGCYEAIIEAIAVGIYLYATFVLTSLLFLNADKAIMYATTMAICLSVIRILVVLF